MTYELGYNQAIKDVLGHLKKATNFLDEQATRIEGKDRASQVAWELRQKSSFFKEVENEVEQQIWKNKTETKTKG